MMEQAEAVGTDAFRRGQEAQLAFFEGMLAVRKGDYATARAKAEAMMQTLEPDANPRKNEPAHELMGLASLLEGKHEEAVATTSRRTPTTFTPGTTWRLLTRAPATRGKRTASSSSSQSTTSTLWATR